MKENIFIKRPAMAISISVMLLIVGIVSLVSLPVEQYPDIAPPTVQVLPLIREPVRMRYRKVWSFRWRKVLTE